MTIDATSSGNIVYKRRITCESRSLCQLLKSFALLKEYEKLLQKMINNETAFVIDIGSENTRIGYAHARQPTIISSTFASSTSSKPKCAIEQGMIGDWNVWEAFITHILQTNDVQSKSIFLTETPLTTNENRVRSAQLLFEKSGADRICVENTAVVSLLANGQTTGVVVDSGFGDTTIVPVFEGYALEKSSHKLEISGSSVTDLLARLLKDKGHSLPKATVVDIKEKLARVAFSFNQEFSECETIDYELPDGTTIPVGNERFTCTEILFNPQMSGKTFAKFFGSGEDVEMDSFTSLKDEIWRSILHSDSSIREELYANILLAGGNTLFPGLQPRLQKEMKERAPSDVEVNVIAPESRQDSSWIGAAISASDTNTVWVTKQEFNEQGASLFYREAM